jgi:hypothetical protein
LAAFYGAKTEFSGVKTGEFFFDNFEGLRIEIEWLMRHRGNANFGVV